MKNFIIIIVFSMLLFGCGGMYKGTDDIYKTAEDDEHVIYKDARLIPSISVVDYENTYVGKLMKVRVKFRNMSVYNVNAEIKIKFLDQSGYEIADNHGWMPLFLSKGELKSLERIAPTPQAADYRIFIQLAGE